jgi:hypothetical protein
MLDKKGKKILATRHVPALRKKWTSREPSPHRTHERPSKGVITPI